MSNTALSLEQIVGSTIWCGFHGTDPNDPGVAAVCSLLADNKLGGVIFYGYNITTPVQTRKLVECFKKARYDAVISVDQEGGKVSRLTEAKGFRPSKSLNEIAKLSDQEISAYYESMAAELADYGFNLNYTPVVDLDDPISSIIHGYGRAISDNPERVAEVAALIIDAHRKYGIATCIKHFPGHGLAGGDTHQDLVDITNTWQEEKELSPYKQLIAQGKADIIMTAHLIHKRYSSKLPVSLISDLNYGILRERFGYDGLIMADDLHMGAISRYNTTEEVTKLSWLAGNDIILFSNNPAAAGHDNTNFVIDHNVAEKVIATTLQLIQEGVLSETQVRESYRRIYPL